MTTALLGELANRAFGCFGATAPPLALAPLWSGDGFAPPIPSGWEHQDLPSGQEFIGAVGDAVRGASPRPLLVLTPFESRGELRSSGTPGAAWDLHDAAAVELASNLAPGALGAILLPAASLTSDRARKARFAIFSRAQGVIVAHLTNTAKILESIPSSFEFALLFLRGAEHRADILRLFQAPRNVPMPAVLSDFDRLLRMQGGRSNFGYVLRAVPPLEDSLRFERHDPVVLGRREELRAFGPVVPLEELFDVTRPPPVQARDDLVTADYAGAAPVLAGRNIARDETIDLSDVRHFASPNSRHRLRAGDLVMRSLNQPGDEPPPLVEVRHEDLPLVAGPHVLVLRPRAQVAPRSRSFVAAFLRSARAVELLRAETTGVHVNRAQLRRLEVPLPDETLSAALEELDTTVQQFERWRREAEALSRSVFNEGRVEDARVHLLRHSEIVRQRAQAAALIDDLGFRIRTRYPYPVAYRWRTAQAARDDTDGPRAITECAEAVLCYCAVVAMLFARAVGVEVSYLQTVRDRLANSSRNGTNLGDWVAVLTEVAQSRRLRSAPTSTPFSEIRGLAADEEVWAGVRRLKSIRDDRAHNRARTANPSDEFALALTDLEVLLEACGFLADYTLTYVVTTRWDSLRSLNTLTVRELIGDHPVVPSKTIASAEVAIEAGSLYLADRRGDLHLLRPLLHGENCPACGNWSTFHLDTFEAASRTCVLKSLEHGHLMQRAELTDAFQAVGLVPG